METLLAAIVDNDLALVKKLVKSDPALATQQVKTAKLFEALILHWLYVGDCALHLAAAGHRVEIVRFLISAGADPDAAANHRRSSPLHYAADGYVNGPVWNADRQVKTITCLLDGGATLNLQDKNGATALHRAVRTRCASAVKCLLNAGSDPTMPNKSGSTPFHLAVQNTGRGGSGSEAALAGQREIIAEFLSRGISTALQDGTGKTVLECAQRSKVIDMLK